MRESQFQKKVIDRIHRTFDRPLVLKNDSGYVQGILDLTVFVGEKWAMLEVKASADAPAQPNQEYYVNWCNEQGAFAAFIYPENEEEVFRGLQAALRA